MSVCSSSAASQSVEYPNMPPRNHKHFSSPREGKTSTHQPVRHKWPSGSTCFYMPVSSLRTKEIRNMTKARKELTNTQVPNTSSVQQIQCPPLFSPQTEQCGSAWAGCHISMSRLGPSEHAYVSFWILIRRGCFKWISWSFSCFSTHGKAVLEHAN